MQIKSKITEEREINIDLETPAFFKEIVSETICSYLGVIEECTISIFVCKGKRTSITNESTERATREIATAYEKWEHISEEEFFEALDKALKDFNFKPSLRHITAREGSEVTVG